MNGDITSLNTWFQTSKLTLNFHKTSFI